MMMSRSISIAGASYFEQWDNSKCFSVQFSDGITFIYTHTNDKLVLSNMLSVGLSSSFLQTGKWPNKTSTNKRTTLANEWFIANKKRYKLLKK